MREPNDPTPGSTCPVDDTTESIRVRTESSTDHPAAPDELRLLTTEEVAELLQVNIKVIYRAVKTGELRRIGLGGSHTFRFRRSDIAAYLDSLALRASMPEVTRGRGYNRRIVR